ncbi:unnamed protein product, partial [Iphiclides podalirius]
MLLAIKYSFWQEQMSATNEFAVTLTMGMARAVIALELRDASAAVDYNCADRADPIPVTNRPRTPTDALRPIHFRA